MALHETIERIRSSPVPPNEETAKLQIVLSDGLQWWLYLPQGLGSPKERRLYE